MSHHELHDLPIPANTSCKFPKYILTLYFTPQSMRPEATGDMIGRRPIPSPYQSSQRRSSRVVVVYSLVANPVLVPRPNSLCNLIVEFWV